MTVPDPEPSPESEDGEVDRFAELDTGSIRVKNKDDIIETWVIEIKPNNQTKEPKKQTRMTKRYINEVSRYAINKYKWNYAEEWCKDRNYKFVIFTEKELAISV